MQAEDALRESERLATSALDALSANIAIVDEAGTIVRVNRSWSEFALANGGVPGAMGVGANYLAICERDDSRVFADGLRAVMAGSQQEFQIEYPCHSPRKQRWFLARITRVASAGPRHVVIAHQEITTRVRTEIRLRHARERLQFATRAGKVGLWDWDLRTNRTSYSREWKRQIGYGDDWTGHDFSEYQAHIHPDDLENVLSQLKTFLAGSQPDFESEFRFRHRDGSYRHILARAAEVRDRDGSRIHLVGSHVDITEFVELQSQLLQAQKMETVGQLAGGIAHDFNNLLMIINATADLALMTLKNTDPIHRDLQDIRSAGERAASLTRQLLTFSRKQIVKPEVLDLGGMVAGLRGMLSRVVGERIALVVSASPDTGKVNADPAQIEQVIMNLAVNARDAMPDGGTLSIETRNVELDSSLAAIHPAVKLGPYVMLAISDTGVGMDETTRARVFEPFFTTKGPGKGTGLGLSTAWGIVQQSGGSIRVSSVPGRGTTITMYLPRMTAAASDSGPP